MQILADGDLGIAGSILVERDELLTLKDAILVSVVGVEEFRDPVITRVNVVTRGALDEPRRGLCSHDPRFVAVFVIPAIEQIVRFFCQLICCQVDQSTRVTSLGGFVICLGHSDDLLVSDTQIT